MSGRRSSKGARIRNAAPGVIAPTGRSPGEAMPRPDLGELTEIDHLIDEKTFTGQVRGYAEMMGWLVYHCHDSRRSPQGFPDLVLVRNPKVVFVELKTQTGRMTAPQRIWRHTLEGVAHDGNTVAYYLWRPSDWEEIAKVLR